MRIILTDIANKHAILTAVDKRRDGNFDDSAIFDSH